MKKKIRSIHGAKELSPCPVVLKDTVINNINNKLIEAKSGNYLIKLISISDLYKVWIDYEYFSDVMIEVTNTNNPKLTTGLNVPGLGPKPIELNVKRKLHTSSFWTWDQFEDQLLDKALKQQISINEEGYYAKSKI